MKLFTGLKIAIGGILLAAGLSAGGAIVVVVHPDNPATDLSRREIQRLYRGQVSSFPGGERVRLGVQRELSERFCEELLEMSSSRFRKHWIKQVFSGSASPSPEPCDSDEKMMDFVVSHPGGIGFLRLEKVDDRVKTITIDGLGPGDDGYVLPDDIPAPTPGDEG